MNVIEDAMARYSEHDTSKIYQAADAFRIKWLTLSTRENKATRR
jgi:hypothetical protein